MGSFREGHSCTNTNKILI